MSVKAFHIDATPACFLFHTIVQKPVRSSATRWHRNDDEVMENAVSLPWENGENVKMSNQIPDCLWCNCIDSFSCSVNLRHPIDLIYYIYRV